MNLKMTKREKIERLLRAYKHESQGIGHCTGNAWATAEEQRKSLADILGSIRGQLRKLGVEVR